MRDKGLLGKGRDVGSGFMWYVTRIGMQLFEDQQVAWMDLPPRANLRQKLKEYVLPHYRRYLEATDISEAFARLNAPFLG